MNDKSRDDEYTEQEAQRRFETALRAGLNTPAKPHADMKLGKPRGKRAKSAERKRKKP
jgi:hypothetical protein